VVNSFDRRSLVSRRSPRSSIFADRFAPPLSGRDNLAASAALSVCPVWRFFAYESFWKEHASPWRRGGIFNLSIRSVCYEKL
jgi:hypothetical protein